MKLGMIGLGKMGANMGRRLMRDGHEVVGFDLETTGQRAPPHSTPSSTGSIPPASVG